MKQNLDGNVNGINETLIESKKNEWKNIGKTWKKNCPICNVEIVYKDKYILNVSLKKKLCCIYCSSKNRNRKRLNVKCSFICKVCDKIILLKHRSDKTVCRKCRAKCNLVRNCPNCNGEIQYTTTWRYKKACEKKIKCSKCRQVNISHYIPYRTPHSEETKNKIRQKYIQRGSLYPNYNKTACLYFEWLNKWNGWNGKYALNGGEFFIKELGYWPDYYEPTYNIVVEWDEKKHFDKNGNLKEKDLKRMNIIKKSLHCRFFRYNEEMKELKEW